MESMIITFDEANKILNTLPIGFYTGRNINVELIKGNKTYYEVVDDKIKIGYDNISKSYSYLMTSSYSSLIPKVSGALPKEYIIRCLLYHEVAHAILTPKNLSITSIVNVAEDERIETICANTFRDVNFKHFVKVLNQYHEGMKPENNLQAWYFLWRFRVGPDKYLYKVEQLIEKYKDLNRASDLDIDYYDYGPSYAWRDDIDKLYKEIFKDENDYKDTEYIVGRNNKSKSDSEGCKKPEDGEVVSIESGEYDSSDDIEPNELLRVGAERLKDMSIDRRFEARMQDIFSRVKKNNKSTGSAINSYSGVFDPRSVVRDDYKYFVQKNRGGHRKHFSKIHLNLFIDNSGSYTPNELNTNRIINSLVRYEQSNKDFSFDLVTMNMHNILHKKDDRVLKCRGGNNLTADIKDIYESIQAKDSLNFSIILFDGDAFSDYHGSLASKQAICSVFDKKNCVIISDYDNQIYFEKLISPKIIYCRDRYSERLSDNIASALEYLSK